MKDKTKSPDAPSAGRIDFDEVRKVIALLEEKSLSEFGVEVDGFKLRISRFGQVPSPPPEAPPAASAAGPSVGEAAAPFGAPPAEPDRNAHVVTSPMVGTFYRAPDPTASPFVDIGDTVKKGQTLCIIEAMKLMNEIESDIDGTVDEIFVENGKPVEYGQKLFAVIAQV